MAQRKRSRTGPSSGQKPGKKSTHHDRLLKIGVGILILGVLVIGAFQFFGGGDNQGAGVAAAAVPIDSGALEATSLEEGRNLEPVDVAPVTDRETRYLGPATDAAGLALAEAGQIGQPTLVWFHADW